MIDPDINIYLLIFLTGCLPTVIWRFLGVYFAEKITEDSEVFIWVRAVATALIAALVMRIVFAPTGLLAQTALSSRVLARCGLCVNAPQILIFPDSVACYPVCSRSSQHPVVLSLVFTVCDAGLGEKQPASGEMQIAERWHHTR